MRHIRRRYSCYGSYRRQLLRPSPTVLDRAQTGSQHILCLHVTYVPLARTACPVSWSLLRCYMGEGGHGAVRWECAYRRIYREDFTDFTREGI